MRIASLPADVRARTSVYALEGQAAHSLAERMYSGMLPQLGQYVSPKGLISAKRASGLFEVTDEMLDAVKVYLAEIEYHRARLVAPRVALERRVYPLPGRSDLFGTADAILVEPYGELVVIDFKYGAGVPVDVEYNEQALYYALGALREIGDDAAVSSVTLVIVQPRAPHSDGPIRRWTIDVEHLRAFKDLLREKAEATEDPGAPLTPGEWCRFCPVKESDAGCPALQQVVLAEAVKDFAAPLPEVRLPDPNDPEQMARALRLADLIEMWPKAVKQMAMNAIDRGVTIPGWKVVRTSAHRKWRDPAEVAVAAGPNAYDEPKLKSPAQLEKTHGKDWVAQYAIKPEGSPVLVPESDRRPAIGPSFLTDFTAIEEG